MAAVTGRASICPRLKHDAVLGDAGRGSRNRPSAFE